MTLMAAHMSPLQTTLRPPRVTPELNPGSKAKDGTTKKSNLDKIKKLIEQLEDVLLMAVNDKGEVQVLASPNLKQVKWNIMGDARETFKEYIQDRDPVSDRNVSEAARLDTEQPSKVRPQAKKSTHGPESGSNLSEGSISYMAQRPAKRQRSRTMIESSCAGTSVTIPVRQPRERRSRRPSMNEMLQIQVDDQARLEQWFTDAFVDIQQVVCRLIAKVWIKKIHPKKQSTHPYNGQMPRDQIADPNRTRPPYWPKNVKHKEPDHIAKDERVKLLVHLVMHTPQAIILNPIDPDNQDEVRAQGLIDCLEEKRGEIIAGPKGEACWTTVQQVIETRKMVEQFEAGEIDGDTLLFLPNIKLRLTRAQQLDSEKELGSTAGHGLPAASDESPSEDVGDDQMSTPASSTLHSPAEDHRVDERPSRSRPHASSATVNGRTRPVIGGLRDRPSWNTRQHPSMTMPRSPQDIPPEMALGMGRFECNIDATMQDAMVAEPQNGLRPVQLHNQLNYGISQQLSAAIPMAPGAFDASAHDVVLVDHHAMSHDMMHGISHGMPVQEDLNYHQPWLAMLDPAMSPNPSHSMFGLHQHMQMQAQLPPHNYFDTSSAEPVAGMPRCSLPLMTPSPPYQVVNHGSRRTLPVRVMSEPQLQMVSLTEEDLESKDVVGSYHHM
ncbi:hypothetical protein LTR84_002940 [Exophiala bonariae]|uniref:Subtelomeric hrmA-associated cluster protein AFUB-079030/YDR124W-like helical bundle domain-containing protein n=1 Tax=Exophiala bonariae TaxID=1690606 RepID=A0AAV9N9D5_9EURO|nr:hypothetical protein LTR84_002940 [Exophiala bonariae]